MIEALLQALTDHDNAYVGIVDVIAGVVRGFVGFGTALIIVPLASRVLAPVEVLVLIVIPAMILLLEDGKEHIYRHGMNLLKLLPRPSSHSVGQIDKTRTW